MATSDGFNARRSTNAGKPRGNPSSARRQTYSFTIPSQADTAFLNEEEDSDIERDDIRYREQRASPKKSKAFNRSRSRKSANSQKAKNLPQTGVNFRNSTQTQRTSRTTRTEKMSDIDEGKYDQDKDVPMGNQEDLEDAGVNKDDFISPEDKNDDTRSNENETNDNFSEKDESIDITLTGNDSEDVKQDDSPAAQDKHEDFIYHNPNYVAIPTSYEEMANWFEAGILHTRQYIFTMILWIIIANKKMLGYKMIKKYINLFRWNFYELTMGNRTFGLTDEQYDEWQLDSINGQNPDFEANFKDTFINESKYTSDVACILNYTMERLDDILGSYTLTEDNKMRQWLFNENVGSFEDSSEPENKIPETGKNEIKAATPEKNNSETRPTINDEEILGKVNDIEDVYKDILNKQRTGSAKILGKRTYRELCTN